MKTNEVVIFGGGESATQCHRFFTKYGFKVDFFVQADKEQSDLFDIPVFQLDELDDDKLVDLDCPIIVTYTHQKFIARIKKRLKSLKIDEHLVFDEPLIYSDWLGELIEALSFNKQSKPNRYLQHLLMTHPPQLNDGPSTAGVLAEYVSHVIQEDLEPDQKTLGVYYPSKAYRMNLGSEDMYDRIRNQGYNVIFLFGVLCGDEFEKRNYSYYAGHDIINSLDFIDVFIIPTVMLGLPEKSKKVLFVHDIYDSPSGKAELPRIYHNGEYPRESAFRDELDYIFLPCKALIKANKIYPLIRKKPLCNIPGGYIKLDSNMHYFANNELPVDSLIYAPTVTDDHFSQYVSVPKYGEKIIGALLDNFTDYKIIFRPHPHTLDTEDVKSIVRCFQGEDRFVFDSNPSFYNDNYCRSAVMVTDMSGTAFTYAFMTLRPVVFFSHKEQEVAKAFDHVKYFEDRKHIGYVATNIDEMKKQVNLALKHTKSFNNKIQEYREANIFNLGHAEDYFVENFHHIAEGTKHPDWQYLIAPLSQSEATRLVLLYDYVDQFLKKVDGLERENRRLQAIIKNHENLIADDNDTI